MTEYPGMLEKQAVTVSGADLANISYTSGTTAEPKGIMLTHENYVSNVLQSDSLIRIPEYFRILLFLPWDHSFAHTAGNSWPKQERSIKVSGYTAVAPVFAQW